MDAMLKFKSIFISDVHLGTRGCQAEKLLEFLQCVTAEKLYCVGDIIDIWAMKKKFFWPKKHNDVIQKILSIAQGDTAVYYVIGNHDELFREFIPIQFGQIDMINEIDHVTANNKRYLVVHGDAWDNVITYAKWLSKLGAFGYNVLLRTNVLINFLRKPFGKSYWSLSQYIKYKVKNIVKYIGEYEKTIAEYAHNNNYHGVICGHIHHASDEDFDGVNYLNCGDWVESCTALVELFDGTFKIIYWDDLRKEIIAHDAIKKPDTTKEIV